MKTVPARADTARTVSFREIDQEWIAWLETAGPPESGAPEPLPPGRLHGTGFGGTSGQDGIRVDYDVGAGVGVRRHFGGGDTGLRPYWSVEAGFGGMGWSSASSTRSVNEVGQVSLLGGLGFQTSLGERSHLGFQGLLGMRWFSKTREESRDQPAFQDDPWILGLAIQYVGPWH